MVRWITWQYLIEITGKKYTPDLDKLGNEGWELVCVVPLIKEKGFQDYKYFFKRKVYLISI